MNEKEEKEEYIKILQARASFIGVAIELPENYTDEDLLNAGYKLEHQEMNVWLRENGLIPDKLDTAKESFRQGWKEMLNGETRPISELWDDTTDTPENMCTPEDAVEIRKRFNEDIEFGRRTDEAIDRCEHGFCTTMTEEEFLDKLESWVDIETKCVCNQKFAVGELVHEIYNPRQVLCEKCYKFYLKVIGSDINDN